MSMGVKVKMTGLKALLLRNALRELDLVDEKSGRPFYPMGWRVVYAVVRTQEGCERVWKALDTTRARLEAQLKAAEVEARRLAAEGEPQMTQMSADLEKLKEEVKGEWQKVMEEEVEVEVFRWKAEWVPESVSLPPGIVKELMVLIEAS